MQIESINTTVRPRTPWEAIDLGFAMCRRYYRAILISWLSCVLPVMLLILISFHKMPWLAGIIIWWLKPLYDKILLFIFSHSLFGPIPHWKTILKQAPQIIFSGALGLLTLHRINMARSFTIPIWFLEKLKAQTARNRIRVLKQQVGQYGVGLTIICLHFELILMLALFGLIGFFIPEYIEFNLFALFTEEHETFLYWLNNFFYIIVISIIEPLYVAAGFCLYINRRIHLEGWDIELSFRHLEQRLS